MKKIQQVAKAMQAILSTVAEKIGRQTKFVKRQSKLTGSKFVQTMVFGYLSNPEATLEEQCQTAASLGVEITPQALDQRLHEQAAKCLEKTLEEAVKQMISADPVMIPMLERFSEVEVSDGSVITLPQELKEIWPGCGGSTGESAALKIQVGLDFKNGTLKGPILQAGRESDQNSPLKQELPQAGSIRLVDLGYFDLEDLHNRNEDHQYWLTRLKGGTSIYNEKGEPYDLIELLEKQENFRIDIPIYLGKKYQIKCRLLAHRVPEEVANERRRKLNQHASRKQCTISDHRRKMAHWVIYVTNAPVELLSFDEAMALKRVRWQIELLFKLWKSKGHIDQWRSTKPWRILCEVYAKLLAMIVQHWIFLVSCWSYPDRSLFKASQTVRKHAINLAITFKSLHRLCWAIEIIQNCLKAGCKINKRKKEPHTYQLLLDCTLGRF